MAKFGKGFPDRPRGSRNPDGTPGPLLNLLPSTGAGCFTVPAVVCLQKVFPEFFQGRWFCFHGDGTSHASEPSLELTGVGSPTTQTLPGYNGLNCAPVTRQRLDGNSRFKTGPVPTSSGDFSVYISFIADAPLVSSFDGVTQDDGVTRPFIMRPQNGSVVCYYNGTANSLSTPTALFTTGPDVTVSTSYKSNGVGNVNESVIYVNGAAVAQSSALPAMPSGNVPWGVGGPTGLKGAIRCAFFTEYCLTQADVTRIQQYLFPLPQGTRGEPLTFARNSLSSMTAPDGTVIWLPPGRPAISGGIKMRPSVTNLLLWSEDFSNASWVKLFSPIITPNAIAAPDGSMTADQVNAVNADGSVSTSTSNDVIANGGAYTLSVWARAVTGSQNNFKIRIRNNTTNVVVSTATANLTNSWIRLSATLNSTTIGDRLGVNIYPGSEGGTGNVYLWGAQLETGTIASDYVRSEGTQGVSAAETCTVPMPGVRTNLLARSQEFDNAVWTTHDVSVSIAGVIAPDGSSTAWKVTPDTVNTFHSLHQNVGGLVENADYTLSWYAKANGVDKTQVVFVSKTGAVQHSRFNLSSGAVDSGTMLPGYVAKILDVGLGWYRCSIQVNAQSGAGACSVDLRAGWDGGAGDGTIGIYAWGAQLETGPCATDYIPTTSAAGSVSSLSTKEGAAEISIVPTWTGANPSSIQINFLVAPVSTLAYMDAASSSVKAAGGITGTNVAGSLISNVLSKFRTKWSNAQSSYSIANKSTSTEGNTGSFSGFNTFGPTLYIGVNTNGVAQPLGATLSDIKLYSYPKK